MAPDDAVNEGGRAFEHAKHNKRMHATADTTILMLRERRGAARDARR